MENENKPSLGGATPMLKQIKPSDLIIGREYYVKMKLDLLDDSDMPLYMETFMGSKYWFHKDQPIFTLEEAPQATLEVREDNTDLKMLVEVASRLYSPELEITIGNAEIITGKTPPSNSEENLDYWIEVNAKMAVRTAKALITACKNQLNQQP